MCESDDMTYFNSIPASSMWGDRGRRFAPLACCECEPKSHLTNQSTISFERGGNIGPCPPPRNRSKQVPRQHPLFDAPALPGIVAFVLHADVAGYAVDQPALARDSGSGITRFDVTPTDLSAISVGRRTMATEASEARRNPSPQETIPVVRSRRFPGRAHGTVPGFSHDRAGVARPAMVSVRGVRPLLTHYPRGAMGGIEESIPC